MRSSRFRCLVLIFSVLLFAVVAQAQGTFTKVDVTGAGTGALQGTGGISINVAGDITGVYNDANMVAHGFLRTANGTITTFDAPGAGTDPGQGTFPLSITTGDGIVGYYSDTSNLYHAFSRNPTDGTFNTGEISGAYLGGHEGTVATNMNTVYDTTGFYRDTNLVYHGILIPYRGATVLFDAMNVGTVQYAGTQPVSINASDEITGWVKDTSYVSHGFVRAADGTITLFDAPGAGGTGTFKGLVGTVPLSINTAGDIAGSYTDAATGARHGFVRIAATGTITAFDVPGAGTNTGSFVFQGTLGGSINDLGVIAGAYSDANNVLHGFVRAASGTITTFDFPGAATTGMLVYGTAAFGINSTGVITGGYTDTNSAFHGFILTPATTMLTPTVTVTPSSTSITTAQALSVTIAVSGGSGNPTPTGTVTLSCGSYASAATALSGGSAMITVPAGSLVLGTDSLTGSYSGDNNYNTATGTSSVSVTQPTPTITTLAPFVVTAGGLGFPLTVNGTNFFSGATVMWGNTSLMTTYISPIELTALVPESLIAAAGSAEVTVSSTGGTSVPVEFTITPTNTFPLLLSLSPGNATADGISFTLTLTGANFASNALVLWNGAVRATTYVSSTQLTATILAADIAKGATNLVTVANPAPNPATAAAQPFLVQ